jgi:hypothetical protein
MWLLGAIFGALLIVSTRRTRALVLVLVLSVALAVNPWRPGTTDATLGWLALQMASDASAVARVGMAAIARLIPSTGNQS